MPSHLFFVFVRYFEESLVEVGENSKRFPLGRENFGEKDSSCEMVDSVFREEKKEGGKGGGVSNPLSLL